MAEKKKKKSKKKEDGEWKGTCEGCPSKSVCSAMQECVLTEMDRLLPKTKAGTAPVPGGKQGYA